MTTAGRPTWNTASGSKSKWEGDLSAQSRQYSARDQPAHIQLKLRKTGQGKPEELSNKNFLLDLQTKEESHHSSSKTELNPSHKTSDKKKSSASSSSKTEAIKARPEISNANLDADDPWREEEDNDEPVASSSSKLDIDDEVEEEDEDNDDDDEDDELILAELAKIKKERAEESARIANEQMTAKETIRMENILRGNPLLNSSNTKAKSSFKVKRRWDDDVVFKNCAKSQDDRPKPGFINDTLRSEFQKKFMKKYIQ